MQEREVSCIIFSFWGTSDEDKGTRLRKCKRIILCIILSFWGGTSEEDEGTKLRNSQSSNEDIYMKKHSYSAEKLSPNQLEKAKYGQ